MNIYLNYYAESEDIHIYIYISLKFNLYYMFYYILIFFFRILKCFIFLTFLIFWRFFVFLDVKNFENLEIWSSTGGTYSDFVTNIYKHL